MSKEDIVSFSLMIVIIIIGFFWGFSDNGVFEAIMVVFFALTILTELSRIITKKSLSRIINTVAITYKNETKNYNTVIEAVIRSKFKKDNKAHLYLTISMIIILAANFYLDTNIIYILIPSLMILLISLNHQLIEYRIKEGFYGGNYYEAREIIQYINEHFDKDDFFNGDNTKGIFPSKNIKITTNNIDGIRL